jgi:hypothetical protein
MTASAVWLYRAAAPAGAGGLAAWQALAARAPSLRLFSAADGGALRACLSPGAPALPADGLPAGVEAITLHCLQQVAGASAGAEAG